MDYKYNRISLIPLSYESTTQEIEKLFKNLVLIKDKIDVIVILENNDNNGFRNWIQIASKYKKFNTIIRMLKNQKSKGSCLNKAIDLCKTEYFMRCDMDDEIYHYRYQETKKIIEENEKDNIDLIYSDMININNNKIIKYPPPRFISILSIWRNPIPAPTICIRKEFLTNKKIQYPPYNDCEDLSLNLKIIDNGGNCIKANKPFVKYSNHISLKRDYENWIKNALTRFSRKRYDLIGILSLLTGILILFYGIFLYFIYRDKS